MILYVRPEADRLHTRQVLLNLLFDGLIEHVEAKRLLTHGVSPSNIFAVRSSSLA